MVVSQKNLETATGLGGPNFIDRRRVDPKLQSVPLFKFRDGPDGRGMEAHAVDDQRVESIGREGVDEGGIPVRPRRASET
jgi:hypothetical protein